MNKNAFTLFELLVVLVIVGILMFVGLPSLSHFVGRNKESVAVNNVVSALHYARSSAISSGENVRFCKSSDGNSCGGTWSLGQIALLDSRKRVLRVFAPLPSNLRLVFNGGFGNDDYLEFTPLGRLMSGAGSFLLSGDGVKRVASWKIIVSQTGRIRTEKLQ